jgi:two-component system, NtrC family, sensor kinase
MSDGHGEDQPEEKTRLRDETSSSASVAHQIKNPLDSLLNLLYLLQAEATLTEKGRTYLALAKEEVSRLSQIAHATLDRAKPFSAKEKTNVSKLLTTVVEFYKQRFEGARITVDTRYCADLTIATYAAQLRQVFSNLLLNAAEAMPEGGKIQARVSRGHEWRGQQRRGVRITIADNGCGIPESFLPQMFQEGFTMKPDGHGIGLSFVRDVVHKHEGALRVKSSTKPGRHGTVFNLFLPAA